MCKNRKNTEKRLPFFGIPRILPYIRPYRVAFIFMMVLGLAGSAADIVLPLFQQYALNHYVADGIHTTLPYFVTLYVLTLVFQMVANFVSTYLASHVQMYVGRDLRQRCFDHLQTLSFSYFNQNSVGYVHSRVMSDTAHIGDLVSWYVIDCVWHVSYLVGVFVVMLCLNPWLTLAVFTVVPLATLLISLCQKKLLKMNRRVRELNSRITGNYNEGITGAKTVKTLRVEEAMEEKFREDTQEMRCTSVRTMHFRSLLSSSVSFFAFLALAIVLWRGGHLTAERAILLGTLQVFMSYAQGIMDPIQALVDTVSGLYSSQVNIERVDALLSTTSDVVDPPEVIAKYGDTFHPKKENWEDLAGDITFEDVTFRYPDGKEVVLEHFSLHVPRGTNVAIVGETGAGKSTLVNLVCRFYEPTEGRILIDGRDARERSQLWLHSHIGYVLQTPHLFSGTVRDNLKYGNPNATDQEILAALDLVSATPVVQRMDKGLDSEVGESGDLLSTGEKQLLSFARAILADPSILILDEATSSIDSVTEHTIQEALHRVTEGRTCFVIAHRLSTVKDADIILAVKDGKIAESGNHASLMAQKGYYHSLYTRQFEKESVDSIL